MLAVSAFAAVNAALRSAGPHAKEEQTSTNHSSQRELELGRPDPSHIPKCHLHVGNTIGKLINLRSNWSQEAVSIDWWPRARSYSEDDLRLDREPHS